MSVDPFTAASPAYQRARSLGVRTVPLARSSDWWPVLKLFGGFAFGAFALGFICMFMLVVL